MITSRSTFTFQNELLYFNEYFSTLLNFRKHQHTSRNFNYTFPHLSHSLQSNIHSIFNSLNLTLNIPSNKTRIDHGEYWYELYPATSNDLNFFLPLLALELSLYPKSFITKLQLKQIIICNSLIFHTQHNEMYKAAFPDCTPGTNAMIYCAKERDVNYIRVFIHHELFHYFDEVGKNVYKSKELWDMFNPKGYSYGMTGDFAGEGKYKELDQKYSYYFFTQYSQSGIEEDKAEVFTWLINSGLSMQELGMKEGLIGKCVSIKIMLEEFDKEGFKQGKDDFWEKVMMFKRVIVDKYY